MEITPKLKRKLRAYINKGRKKGYSEFKIKKALLKAGYTSEQINPLFKKKDILPYVIIALATLIVILGIILGFVLKPITPDTDCNTADCFIGYANLCSPTTLTMIEDGTTTFYEIRENCLFYREYTKLADDEPDEIRELLEGKSMTCPYTMGNFDKDLVNTVSLGIENCEGELVDGLYTIILAVS